MDGWRRKRDLRNRQRVIVYHFERRRRNVAGAYGPDTRKNLGDAILLLHRAAYPNRGRSRVAAIAVKATHMI